MRTAALFALVAATIACGSEPPAPSPDAAAPCGGACGPGTTCSAGRCVATEADAGPDNGPDVTTEAGAETGSDVAPMDAPVCPEGFAQCGGAACIDLRNTLEHCGLCNAPCFLWGRCVMGRCTPADLDGGLCPAGRRDCNQALHDECEVDITSTDMSCGACGRACGVRERCVAGACTPR